MRGHAHRTGRRGGAEPSRLTEGAAIWSMGQAYTSGSGKAMIDAPTTGTPTTGAPTSAPR
jgi:hypothetical protein